MEKSWLSSSTYTRIPYTLAGVMFLVLMVLLLHHVLLPPLLVHVEDLVVDVRPVHLHIPLRRRLL